MTDAEREELIPIATSDGPDKDALDQLAHLEQRDQRVHAFVAEADRRARVELARLNAPAGPLHDVLVGVKDIIGVDGLATRAGSALPAQILAGPQAVIVDRVIAAGGIVAGKTVTAEFALSEPGPTRNPRHPGRTPGGSSSGSAAAVAAGMVPLALGTQTVGSVIRPAAFCGVVGFRPTWGVIPLDGVITNARSLDTIGFFTADVRSVIAAAQVLCGFTPPASSSRPPVLGVPTGPYLDAAEPSARVIFEEQVRRVQDRGYQVRPVPLVEDLDTMRSNLRLFQRFELARAHDGWYPRHGQLYRPGTRAAIEEGRRISPTEYRASAQWRQQFIATLASTMADSGIDAWVTPAATGPPPLGLRSTGSPEMSAPFSFAGMPALSLPTPDGHLSHGLQIVAGPGRDRELLAWALGLEAALALPAQERRERGSIPGSS